MTAAEQSEEIVVSLENRPGTLADACEALAEAGVNIEGVSCVAQGPFGVARFVTPDPDGTFSALENAGLTPTRRTTTRVTLTNEPGQLARTLRSLEQSGINVESLFASATPDSETGPVVIETSDPAGTQKALG